MVIGDISKVNCGLFDLVLDQMMVKQKLVFDCVYIFDFVVFVVLFLVEICFMLEYDGCCYSLCGLLFLEVLCVVGGFVIVQNCVLCVVDGYVVLVLVEDIVKYCFIIVIYLDGKFILLGGFGLLWVVYDVDSFFEMSVCFLLECFGQCLWGLYYIVVCKV